MSDSENRSGNTPRTVPQVLAGYIVFILAVVLACLIVVFGVPIGLGLLITAGALAYVAAKTAGWRPAIPAFVTGIGVFALVPVVNDAPGGPTRWHLALLSGVLIAVGVLLLLLEVRSARKH